MSWLFRRLLWIIISHFYLPLRYTYLQKGEESQKTNKLTVKGTPHYEIKLDLLG